MSEEGSEESQLPCCEELEKKSSIPSTFPSLEQDYTRMTMEWFGEDRSLHLPSPPSGSVSAIMEEEAKISSMEVFGEKSEEKIVEEQDDKDKYCGIRVCPCKRVERVESEVEEMLEERGESERVIEEAAVEGEVVQEYLGEEEGEAKEEKEEVVEEEVEEEPVAEIKKKRPKVSNWKNLNL